MDQPNRRAVRWIRHRISPGGLILLYHYIIESPDAHSPMRVTPGGLAQQLEILRKYAYPMSLRQLVQALGSGHLPHRAVVVTFDDGYADNVYHAKPLLERHDIPATVFVTTGYLGHEREFWWDELKRLFLQLGPLPDKLCLKINGIPSQWELEPSPPDGHDDRRHQRFWNTKPKNAPLPRRQVYRSLHKLLKAAPEEERKEIMDALLRWAGTSPVVRSPHRPMTPEEVRRLAEGELVEIGAHTVTHPVLSTLSESSQRDEIRGCKYHLEEILGHPVNSFAYPYGSRRDYTVGTVGLVQEAGFDCACANFRDVVFRGTDCYQLPRIPVQNWDAEEFGCRLGILV